jgi:hypothetical protein
MIRRAPSLDGELQSELKCCRSVRRFRRCSHQNFHRSCRRNHRSIHRNRRSIRRYRQTSRPFRRTIHPNHPNHRRIRPCRRPMIRRPMIRRPNDRRRSHRNHPFHRSHRSCRPFHLNRCLSRRHFHRTSRPCRLHFHQTSRPCRHRESTSCRAPRHPGSRDLCDSSQNHCFRPIHRSIHPSRCSLPSTRSGCWSCCPTSRSCHRLGCSDDLPWFILPLREVGRRSHSRCRAGIVPFVSHSQCHPFMKLSSSIH